MVPAPMRPVAASVILGPSNPLMEVVWASFLSTFYSYSYQFVLYPVYTDFSDIYIYIYIYTYGLMTI